MAGMVHESEVGAKAVEEPRLEQMRKIVASQSFAKAPRLCSFLSYIVEKSIAGDVDSLTEQQIGIHVFNRAPGYNSNDDNIVRGTARALRQRLATYYLTEGAADRLLIEIPKGAYVARFEEAPSGTVAQEALSSEVTEPRDLSFAASREAAADVQPSKQRRHWFGWAVAAVCVLVAVVPYAHERYVQSRDPAHLLWSTVFSHDRPTYVVPGDAGLNMYETLGGRIVGLEEYSQQSYADSARPEATLADRLGTRFYTTMSDLQLVANIVRVPEADPARVHVRFARDLAASDIKDANLVLLGTRSYNPWTELYQSKPTLKMSWDVNQDLFTVTNLAPQSGELPQYQWTVKNGTKGALTLISLTDNPQGGGRVLLVEGTTMLAVYAAADFLANKELRDPILRRAKHADGTLGNFDVLLQSDFIREGVSNLKVLAAHTR